MNENTQLTSTSISTIPHKFFERFLDNNLEKLTSFLQSQYQRIENGEIIKTSLCKSCISDIKKLLEI